MKYRIQTPINKKIYEITMQDDLAEQRESLHEEHPELFEGLKVHFVKADDVEEATVRVTIDFSRNELENTDIIARLLDAVGHRKIQIEGLK